MAQVFISYSKQDPESTRKLAATIEAQGFTVWWDTSLVGGANYREVILSELAAAKAVIVVWTQASVKSDWVISEADRARDAQKLIPVRVPTIKTLEIPPPFDRLHTHAITDIDSIISSLRGLLVSSSGGEDLMEGGWDDALTCWARGINADVAGQHDVAIARFTRAIELNKDVAAAFMFRADNHLAKGDTVSALADYRRSLELDSSKEFLVPKIEKLAKQVGS